MAHQGEQKKTFERKPIPSIRFRKSEDRKYVIVERIETWIFPRKYFEAVLAVPEKAQEPNTSAHEKDG